MSDTPIRRSNWPPTGEENPQRQDARPETRYDDPLAELERIVGRTTPPAPASATTATFRQPTARAATPSPIPTSTTTPAPSQATPTFSAPAPLAPPVPEKKSSAFLGINEDDFEAAFRALEQKSQAVQEKPLAPQTPIAQQPLSASRTAPTFTPVATPQQTPASSFSARRDSLFTPKPTTAPTASSFSTTRTVDDWDMPASAFDYPDDTLPLDAPTQSMASERREFEQRSDAFDFDRQAEQAASSYDDAERDEDIYEPEASYLSERKPRSGFVTIMAVTGLVFIAVMGALIYSWVGDKDDGQALVVNADPTPVKTSPGTEPQTPSSNKLIYDRLGNATEEADNEQVVSREEQPVDTLNSGATANLDAPRAVTTTTIRVRPDGTLETVPSAAASVSPQTLPPVVPPATSTSSPPVAATAPAALPDQNFAGTTTTASTAQTAGPSTPDEEDVPSAALTPATRDVPRSIVPQVQTQQTEAAPTPTATQRVASAPATQTPRSTTTTASSSGGGFVVQLSSQRNEAQAQASFSSIQGRFPQVLSGYSPSIKPVDLGAGKGTYYRVRVGPLSTRNEASALCTRLKAAGGDCVVTVN